METQRMPFSNRVRSLKNLSRDYFWRERSRAGRGSVGRSLNQNGCPHDPVPHPKLYRVPSLK